MGKYILKRLGYMLLVLIILSFLMYMIYNLVPNNRADKDAREEVKARKQLLQSMTSEEQAAYFEETLLKYQRLYGTDTNNMVLRYLRWMGLAPNYYGEYDGLLQGNFGYSYEHDKPVIEMVVEPMKNTIFINIFATILALAITIPLGIYCAVRKGRKFDQSVQVISIIGYSLPTFITAILFIWIFCSKLGWFPPSGMNTPGAVFDSTWDWFVDRMYYLALPLITMTFCSLGGMTRYVRASMIDALSMDCIRTARAKGVRERSVIYSHAFRNALIPIVTLVVGWFLGIFAGSLVFENMFGLNGMGKIMIQGLRSTDFDVVLLLQLFYVAISLVGNLVIDIIYGLVDPRVRVSK